MHETQFRQLEDELRREVDIAIARANGGSKAWRVSQIIVMISSLVLTAIVLPWGVWVTKQIQSIREQQVAFDSWKNIGPRFTSTDAENLRMRVMTEVMDKVDRKFDTISVKLDHISNSLNEHMLNTQQRPKPQSYFWQPGLLQTNAVAAFITTNIWRPRDADYLIPWFEKGAQ